MNMIESNIICNINGYAPCIVYRVHIPHDFDSYKYKRIEYRYYCVVYAITLPCDINAESDSFLYLWL